MTTETHEPYFVTMMDGPATEETWQKALLPADCRVRQAIENLDASALQIALVISPDGVLVGTITDGDIRRGLLRGVDLDSPIETIIHREALVVPPELGRESVLQLMRANVISALPIVDSGRRVLGLHRFNQILVTAARANTMLIMAGGQGTRLLPHTENCPKPLLEVAGKPMLEHLIIRAKAEGFTEFVLAVHYLGYMIEDYFGDGSRWDVNIDYVREESPLGTAGAIALMNPRPSIPFLVSNGDVMTDIRYAELLDFHCRNGASATMAVRFYEWQHPFGVVHTDGVDIVSFEEKPIARSRINAGVYVLDPGALDVLIPGEPCDMPTLFTRLQEIQTRTIVYPVHEPWLDVGRLNDLEEAQTSHRRTLK